MSDIIAVTGASGAGKTTLAASLACGLAEKSKVVIILSGEMSYGTIQTFFNQTIPAEKGIMAALTNTFAPVQNYLIQCRDTNKNIYIMGVPNDNDDIFIDTLESSKAKNLVKTLAGFADYLIIDTSANLLNPFTILGVEYARFLFCMYKASTNSALWHKSIKNKFESLTSGTIYPVVAKYSRGCGEEEFMKASDISAAYLLPDVASAPVLENIGVPIYYGGKSGIGQKGEVKQYKKTVDEIVAEIVKSGGVG